METVVSSVSIVTAQPPSQLLRRQPSKEEFGEGLEEDKEGAAVGMFTVSSSSLLGLTYLHTISPAPNQMMKSLMPSLTS